MITLKNLMVYKNGFLRKLNVGIENGRIQFVEQRSEGEVVDCDGLIALPGLIDMHVHFREPGLEWKEDWRSGSKAAVHGGITYVADMPNTKPPVIYKEILEKKVEIAKSKSLVNFGLYGAITNENVKSFSEMDEGVIGYKIFLAASTGNLLLDEKYLAEAISSSEKPVMIHPESQKIVEKYLARPIDAEIEAVKKVVSLQGIIKTRVHLCHITSFTAASIVLEQRETNKLTFETCPHYLFLNDRFRKENGGFGKVNPPLRSEEERKGLFNLVVKGKIDVLSSDHAPHTVEEKKSSSPHSGIPGVETTVYLMLNLVKQKLIDFGTLVRMMNEIPREILGLNNYGEIIVGNKANMTIVDLNRRWIITKKFLQTKCGWSPYEGMEGYGMPVYTIVNGKIFDSQKVEVVYDESEG
ncbi:MAG: dihydroorotase [Candidatus Aenigmarchaeota archaeon]|nr:dihydroorotase [Candidatus Aenigmarchaeota archaeon]